MSGRILPDLTQTVVALHPNERPLSERDALILNLYTAKKPIDYIAAQADCSKATVDATIDRLGLPRRGRGAPGILRGKRKARKTRKAVARHGSHLVGDKSATLLPVNNPALTEKRTVYTSTVVSPRDHPRCLIPARNNRKIGGVVRKGSLKGMPIFTLALEERATCPATCRHWRSCYANNMHFLKRFRHGEDLEKLLPLEIGGLMRQFPGGILVRLHIAGDFYSVDYVRVWKRLLDAHPKLHVFGFTARIDGDDPICRELVALTLRLWPRFAMRFSNANIDELATASIEHPLQKPADAVICPAQTGQAESCSTCALCWQGKTNIAFLQH
ncbi:GP88 family protein [Oricola sp.]|uniref:GP88 family protein n=1 Tax=Oricola sp. TaxID=1979950 RepID=UPI003BA9F9C6